MLRHVMVLNTKKLEKMQADKNEIAKRKLYTNRNNISRKMLQRSNKYIGEDVYEPQYSEISKNQEY